MNGTLPPLANMSFLVCIGTAVHFIVYIGTVGQLENKCCDKIEQLQLAGAKFFGTS
jgi:hypothetical protein